MYGLEVLLPETTVVVLINSTESNIFLVMLQVTTIVVFRVLAINKGKVIDRRDANPRKEVTPWLDSVSHGCSNCHFSFFKHLFKCSCMIPFAH